MKWIKHIDTFLNERKMSNEYLLFKLVNQFSQQEETSWYLQGGCYDFAIAFGKIVKDLNLTPIYWSYGSKQEPYVHVAVQCDNYYYDASNQYKDIYDLSGNGDYYTDTVCDWEIIDEKTIPGNNANIEALYENFKQLLIDIRHSNL